MRTFFAFILSVLILFTIGMAVHADELEDINKELDQLKSSLDSSKKATATNEQQLNQLKIQLEGIKNRVAVLEREILVKEKEVKTGEEKLAEQKKILDERVVSYYKNLGKNSTSFVQLLVSDNLSKSLHQFFYQKSILDDDRRRIVAVVMYIKDLEDRKAKLQSEKIRLEPIKAEVDKQSQFLAGEVDKAKKYEGELSSKIADLSAKQQEIINAKGGGFIVNIGDSELADDYNASIKGFRESAPAGYFAVFSIGAYTHRNGMSQYGALGRVRNSGWNYEQLLKYYYPGVSFQKVDNRNITVYGTNSYGQTFNDEQYSLEDYLKHIYEVPTSWPSEVLKAQAIAARSYAYKTGDRICSGQSCQEFKREENTDTWKQAVKDTEGMIMTGGSGSFQYSSTSGGWVNGVGWDTTDGNGGSNFIDKAYEKLAGSPWVYKAWYTKTYRNDSDKCGRSNPWLSPEEMADIVNAALVLRSGNDSEKSRITPVTTSCWGGNPYSMEELRNVASKYSGFGSATSVSVSQGNGTTNQVTINGVSMSGEQFKQAFILRAPAYVTIKQDGFAFFNIEKK